MAEKYSQAALDDLEAAIGKDGLGRVLSAFIGELKDNRPNFVDFGDSLDLDQLCRHAHTLKSTAGTFGAVALQDAARQMEEATRLEQVEKALELQPSVLALLDETIAYYSKTFDS